MVFYPLSQLRFRPPDQSLGRDEESSIHCNLCNELEKLRDIEIEILPQLLLSI